MAQADTKLSIVIPVYNEAPAISELLRRVCKTELPEWCDREVVIVDDGSTDETTSTIREFTEEHPEHTDRIRIHESHINHGKGAALRAGFKIASGDLILVQDGDLEYSPADYPTLIEPFRNPEVQVVYGSRFYHGLPRGMKLPNLVANLILSAITTLLYGQRITDEATGYKVFRRSVLDRFELRSRRFEFCPEFTGHVLKAGFRIHEVPISYNPRGILEGKKIKTSDGFVAIYWLLKVWFRETFKRRRGNPKAEPVEDSR
jgi:glycosyltransferase involved in cell wall biosynthesis